MAFAAKIPLQQTSYVEDFYIFLKLRALPLTWGQKFNQWFQNMNISKLDKIFSETAFQIILPLVMLECVYLIYFYQYQVILKIYMRENCASVFVFLGWMLRWKSKAMWTWFEADTPDPGATSTCHSLCILQHQQQFSSD